jgi:hypothetical protein
MAARRVLGQRESALDRKVVVSWLASSRALVTRTTSRRRVGYPFIPNRRYLESDVQKVEIE